MTTYLLGRDEILSSLSHTCLPTKWLSQNNECVGASPWRGNAVSTFQEFTIAQEDFTDLLQGHRSQLPPIPISISFLFLTEPWLDRVAWRPCYNTQYSWNSLAGRRGQMSVSGREEILEISSGVFLRKLVLLGWKGLSVSMSSALSLQTPWNMVSHQSSDFATGNWWKNLDQVQQPWNICLLLLVVWQDTHFCLGAQVKNQVHETDYNPNRAVK